MPWEIRFTPQAQKALSKLDRPDAGRILKFLQERVAIDPRSSGGPLKGSLRDFWRWRIGDYRVLAKIEQNKLLVLVVQVGHRRSVYDL